MQSEFFRSFEDWSRDGKGTTFSSKGSLGLPRHPAGAPPPPAGALTTLLVPFPSWDQSSKHLKNSDCEKNPSNDYQYTRQMNFFNQQKQNVSFSPHMKCPANPKMSGRGPMIHWTKCRAKLKNISRTL